MDRKQILLDHLAIAKTSIALDPTYEGVKLPKHIMDKDTVVRLNLSNNYPMEFRQDKVIATLKFGGVPFECHIPYQAIFAVFIAGATLEDAVVFEESVPMSSKRLMPLIESGNVDFLRFMADLQLQFLRDDITVGQYNDKPQWSLCYFVNGAGLIVKSGFWILFLITGLPLILNLSALAYPSPYPLGEILPCKVIAWFTSDL